MEKQKYLFKIPIGDWSDDGHGKCEWFEAEAEKPFEDIREAYFTAKEKYPDLCPESFCCEYEDSKIPENIRQRSKELDDNYLKLKIIKSTKVLIYNN